MPPVRQLSILIMFLVIASTNHARVDAAGDSLDEPAAQSSARASDAGKTDEAKGQTATPQPAAALTSEQIREFFNKGTIPEDLFWKPGASTALKGPVKTLQFSPDGGAVVVHDTNEWLHILRVSDGYSLGSFKPDGEVRSFAISPDHQHLAVGNQKVVIYEVATGKPVFTHNAYEGDVSFVSVSRDGKQLLGTDKTGRIHRTPLLTDGGATVTLNKEAPGALNGLSCSQDQARLLISLANRGSLLVDFTSDITQKPQAWDVNGMINGATRMSVGQRIVLVERPEGVSVLKQDDKAGQMVILKWNPNLTEVAGFRVASDDSRIFAWAPEGTVRMLDFKTSYAGLVSQSPISRLSTLFGRPVIDVAPDCRTMAIHQSGRLSIFHLTVDPALRRKRFESVISPLLAGGQYDRLQELCELVRTGGSEDFTEAGLFGILQPKADDATGAAQETELTNWVNARPKSFYPRIALAEHHYSTAWQHRGRGLAETVTEEESNLFLEHIEKATSYLDPIKSGDNSPKHYFVMKMKLHTSGSDPHEAFVQTSLDVLKYCPDHIDAHRAASMYLMPRWHGEPGDLAVYLDQVIKAIGEKRGNAVVIGVVQHQLPFYRHDFYEATGLDYQRLKPMLESAMNENPLAGVSRDQVLAVYSGVARRADDIAVVRTLVGRMSLEKWLDRNQHQPGTYRDVENTFAWLEEKDGEGAVHRSALSILPSVPGLEDAKFPPLPGALPQTNETPPTPDTNPPKR